MIVISLCYLEKVLFLTLINFYFARLQNQVLSYKISQTSSLSTSSHAKEVNLRDNATLKIMEQCLQGPWFGNQPRHLTNILPSYFLQKPNNACPPVTLFLLILQTYFSNFSFNVLQNGNFSSQLHRMFQLSFWRRQICLSASKVKNSPPPLCLGSVPEEFSSGGFFWFWE